jgi:uncharacterized protein YhhL (DUF1145 family)
MAASMSGVKAGLAVIWLLCAASFFVGGDSSVAGAGRLLFFVLLAAHAVECLVFLPRLRAAPGGLAGHLVQTLIFGVLHVRGLGGGEGKGDAPCPPWLASPRSPRSSSSACCWS